MTKFYRKNENGEYTEEKNASDTKKTEIFWLTTSFKIKEIENLYNYLILEKKLNYASGSFNGNIYPDFQGWRLVQYNNSMHFMIGFVADNLMKEFNSLNIKTKKEFKDLYSISTRVRHNAEDYNKFTIKEEIELLRCYLKKYCEMSGLFIEL